MTLIEKKPASWARRLEKITKIKNGEKRIKATVKLLGEIISFRRLKDTRQS